MPYVELFIRELRAHLRVTARPSARNCAPISQFPDYYMVRAAATDASGRDYESETSTGLSPGNFKITTRESLSSSNYTLFKTDDVTSDRSCRED